jgi:endonuclease YncB( thermonuclease family)
VLFRSVETIPQESAKATKYLGDYVKGREVFIKFDPSFGPSDNAVAAYLYLKNKIFINKEMIRQRLAKVPEYFFKYKDNFVQLERAGA